MAKSKMSKTARAAAVTATRHAMFRNKQTQFPVRKLHSDVRNLFRDPVTAKSLRSNAGLNRLYAKSQQPVSIEDVPVLYAEARAGLTTAITDLSSNIAALEQMQVLSPPR